jgi:CHRD domain
MPDRQLKEGAMTMSLSRRAVLLGVALASIGMIGMAQAATESFKVELSGANQAPPITSSGTGTADITYDPATRVVTWSITYSGLSSPVTMAHFHHGAVGKNGPVVIWLTQRGQSVSSPITGKATLSADQAKEFIAGEWYINVHTDDHPGGELRGQVIPPKG